MLLFLFKIDVAFCSHIADFAPTGLPCITRLLFVPSSLSVWALLCKREFILCLTLYFQALCLCRLMREHGDILVLPNGKQQNCNSS